MKLYSECEEEFLKDYEATAIQVLEYGLKKLGCPYDTQISLYIVNEEEIAKVNKAQRGIDRPTDVLSFPNVGFADEADFSCLSEDDADCFDPESGELILGEIMICAQKVYTQAKEYGHSDKREYAFLLTHSLLHLLGYDHENDEERKRMEAMQDEILDELGIVRA